MKEIERKKKLEKKTARDAKKNNKQIKDKNSMENGKKRKLVKQKMEKRKRKRRESEKNENICREKLNPTLIGENMRAYVGVKVPRSAYFSAKQGRSDWTGLRRRRKYEKCQNKSFFYSS